MDVKDCDRVREAKDMGKGIRKMAGEVTWNFRSSFTSVWEVEGRF